MPFVPQASDAARPLDCSAVLTHHWFVRRRGGEKVLEALGELTPAAPLYTLVHDAAGVSDSPLAARRIHTSLLQWLPGATRLYPKLLPLHPLAARLVQLPAVDLVLCSDAALAKAMTPAARSKVVCYCHSPMRYVFDDKIAAQYCATLPRAVRGLWPALTALVRAADLRAARRVDLFVANSRHVAQRIRLWYAREAVVVYPPVDLPPKPIIGPREPYYLCIGYHTPYKRLDLAIEACQRAGRRLVVIGDGPEVTRLKNRPLPLVEFIGWQSAEVINQHLTRATALLFPGEEDFGIVPVEAIAHGCPVIAYAVGGATETVVHNESGVHVQLQTADAFAEALEYCEMLSFDTVAMHTYAQRFSRARFLSEMRAVLMSVLRGEAPARTSADPVRSGS